MKRLRFLSPGISSEAEVLNYQVLTFVLAPSEGVVCFISHQCIRLVDASVNTELVVVHSRLRKPTTMLVRVSGGWPGDSNGRSDRVRGQPRKRPGPPYRPLRAPYPEQGTKIGAKSRMERLRVCMCIISSSFRFGNCRTFLVPFRGAVCLWAVCEASVCVASKRIKCKQPLAVGEFGLASPPGVHVPTSRNGEPCTHPRVAARDAMRWTGVRSLSKQLGMYVQR